MFDVISNPVGYWNRYVTHCTENQDSIWGCIRKRVISLPFDVINFLVGLELLKVEWHGKEVQ